MAYQLLLVDDSVTVHKAVQITFACEDFNVIATASAEEALQKARQTQVDLVLIDLHLPGTDGYSVCQALRADASLGNAPMLLMGNSADPVDEARAQACGATGHFQKPFETQNLIDRARTAVGAPAIPGIAPPMTATIARAAPRPVAQPAAVAQPAVPAAFGLSGAAPTPAFTPVAAPRIATLPTPAPFAQQPPATPASAPAFPTMAHGAPGAGFAASPRPTPRPAAPPHAPLTPAGLAPIAPVVRPPVGPPALGHQTPPIAPAARAPLPTAPAARPISFAPTAPVSPPAKPSVGFAPLASAPASSSREWPVVTSNAPAVLPIAAPARPAPAATFAAPPASGLSFPTAPAAPSAPSAPVVSAAQARPNVAPAGAMSQAVDQLAQLNVSGLDENELRAMAREIIERIAWEVVPVLAETLIREQLARQQPGGGAPT